MGEQTAQNPTKSYICSTFRGETMLRSDTCFAALKVSDARKGVESHSEAVANGAPTNTPHDRMQGAWDGIPHLYLYNKYAQQQQSNPRKQIGLCFCSNLIKAGKRQISTCISMCALLKRVHCKVSIHINRQYVGSIH